MVAMIFEGLGSSHYEGRITPLSGHRWNQKARKLQNGKVSKIHLHV